jgi:hypothetical protein
LTVLLPAKSQLLPTSRPALFLTPVMCKNIMKVQTKNKQTNKLRGLSPRANYTNRATAVVG